MKALQFASGILWIGVLFCVPVIGWALSLWYIGHWASGGFNE